MAVTMLRRCVDFFAAMLLLIATFPLLLLGAFAIWAASGSPIFFYQTRVGLRGRRFILFKLRTMSAEEGKGAEFQPGDTSRVTPVGRLLRRFKVDELPQLFNVLRGDMAIVGPRPEVPQWVEDMPAVFEPVLAVRPGLTDPASIAFRNESSMLLRADDPILMYREVILPKKLAMSTDYLRHRTILRDIGVVGATILSLVGLPHPWNSRKQ